MILILRFCTNGFCYSKMNCAVYTTIIIKYISNCDKAEFVTRYGLWLMADTQNLLAFQNQPDVLPVSLEMTLSARESASVFAVSCILVWADVHWCLQLCTPWTKIRVATLERPRYTKLSAFSKRDDKSWSDWPQLMPVTGNVIALRTTFCAPGLNSQRQGPDCVYIWLH